MKTSIAASICIFALAADAFGADLINMQKRFIRELFDRGRYYEAIAETRRLMAVDPGAEADPGLRLFIGVNYFLGGQYRSAVRGIAGGRGARDWRESVLVSQSYLRLGHSIRALNAIRGVEYGGVDPPFRYHLLARKAEAYLENRMYRGLLGEIDRAAPFITDRERVMELRTGVEGYRRLPLRSTPLAVALSVFVPGAGQMYAGKYLIGAASFAAVAATAGGAVYCGRRGRTELTGVLAAFASIFYIGNIISAYGVTVNVNEKADQGFRDDLNRRCIPRYDPAAEVRRGPIFEPEGKE